MPIPSFITSLRAKIGHELLWLPGVTAVVLDGAGRVLLGQRSDTGRWALPSGIPEPGEQLGEACAREVAEETGITAVLDRLLRVETTPVMSYPNGDRCQFVDHVFVGRAVSGTAHVGDDESLAVGWFSPDALPPDLREGQRDAVRLALAPAGPTLFS